MTQRHGAEAIGLGLRMQVDVVKAVGLEDQLARRVPRRLFERPKMGFGVPLANWLAGPLADRVADSLGAREFRECGWLDRATVKRVVGAFGSGRVEYAGAVWKLFVLSEALQKLSAARLSKSTHVGVGAGRAA